MEKYSKCNGELHLYEISSGGDDLLMCTECDWIEDVTKIQLD